MVAALAIGERQHAPGMAFLEWQTDGYNVLAHSIVDIGGFVLLGGLKLFRRQEETPDDGVRDRPDIRVQQHVLPMVSDLAEQIGAVEHANLAWSITVGGGLVDLSALSTVGALYLAAAPPGTNTRALFNALLAWGLSMSVVGAALCWILFG